MRVVFSARPAGAEVRSKTAGALQASNILNPNISVIGWFQAEAGRRHLEAGVEEPAPFQFKEVEIAFQSIVDPYTRADIFVAIEGEGVVEIEEAYLSSLRLPYDLGLKVGKFKANFGTFNRTHRPETAFADRPLVHEKFFGGEGLSGAGASLSWHVPNPWIFVNVDAEVTNAPEAAETPAFDKARKRDLLYLGRLNGYYDLTEAANVAFGGSYVYGSAGQEAIADINSFRVLRSQLYGLDLTFRWKNPRRAIYRSVLWRTEILWNKKDVSHLSPVTSMGLFSHLEYQFARRWSAGSRYDWSEAPGDNAGHDQGGLLYLTFTPTEYSLISLQGRHVRRVDGTDENLGFLKVTFNIGPHGTHPF